MLDSFLGNERLKQELTLLLQTDRLPHAVVIQAEEGEGGGFLSKLIAAAYLKDENGLVERGIHPDCILVEGSGASGMISIQTVREILYEANKAAVMSDGRRVVLIRRAENLNASSSNALLKMLEEPPEGVLFLLTVRKTDDLLPTILSRVAVYRCQSLSKEICVQALLDRVPGCDRQRAEEVSELFDGRLGLALRALSDSEYAVYSALGKSFCEAAVSGNLFDILRDLSEAADRNSSKLLLQAAVIRLRRMVRTGEGNVARLGFVLDEVTEAYNEITNNTNLKLIQTRLGYRLAGKEE